MAHFVKKYIKGCATCQQSKTNTHPTAPPLNPIQSKETLPFKQISYDLITDLPISNGFDSLLVVVDQGLTKGVILCPTKKSITAEGVATSFSKNCIPDLDFSIKSSPTEAHNSWQNSKGNWHEY